MFVYRNESTNRRMEHLGLAAVVAAAAGGGALAAVKFSQARKLSILETLELHSNRLTRIGDVLAGAGLSLSQAQANAGSEGEVGMTLCEARLARGAALLSGSVYKSNDHLKDDVLHYYGCRKPPSASHVRCFGREHGGARYAFIVRDSSVCSGCRRCTSGGVFGTEFATEEDDALTHVIDAPIAHENQLGSNQGHDHPQPESNGWTLSNGWKLPHLQTLLRRNDNDNSTAAVADEYSSVAVNPQINSGTGTSSLVLPPPAENIRVGTPDASQVAPSPLEEDQFLRRRKCDRGILADAQGGNNKSSLESDCLDGIYHRSECIFIAVRGSTTIGDWVANVQSVSLTQMLPSRLIGNNTTSQTRFGVTVHSAYFMRARAILNDLELADARHRELHSDRPMLDRRRPIVICGHSMGGAVAALLAVLITDEWHWPASVRVISFGSPAFGGEGLRRLSALSDILRFIAPGDVVPTLAPPGYEHVGRTVSLASTPRRFLVSKAHSLAGRAHASAGGKVAAGQLALALGAVPHSIVGYRDRLCATIDVIEAAVERAVQTPSKL